MRGVPWLMQERATTDGPVIAATGYARAARGLRRAQPVAKAVRLGLQDGGILAAVGLRTSTGVTLPRDLFGIALSYAKRKCALCPVRNEAL